MAGEKEFRKWLIQNAGKEWLMQTIETATGSGVPDVFMCADGQQCWAELKSTDSKKCYMRISQWRWFTKLCQRGGKGVLIIKRCKTRMIDVYDASILTAPSLSDSCELRGQDVVFPDDIKPAFSYKLGTGNGIFYGMLLDLLKRN